MALKRPQLRTLAEGPSDIVGSKLSSVEFVQDYLQLHFDGSTLTTYTLPTLKLEDVSLNRGQVGFRDALCGQIDNVVEAVSINDHISLSFATGAIVKVSLRDEDYRGSEAIQFSVGDELWIQ